MDKLLFNPSLRMLASFQGQRIQGWNFGTRFPINSTQRLKSYSVICACPSNANQNNPLDRVDHPEHMAYIKIKA
jgi:hypothetical protein